jgi:nucleotide-binding universal stress UspA family protein
MPPRILVAVDESEGARRAAEFTNEFFGVLDVETLVLNVAATPVPWFPGVGGGVVGPYAWRQVPVGAPGEPVAELMIEARDQAGHVAAASGVEDADPIAEVGDPVDAIRATAVAEDVDLIVVGTSDKGWWRRLLEGSVSDALVRSAECPVLVVR